jgi:hypothetical protein
LKACKFHKFMWSRDSRGRLHLMCVLCHCVFDWHYARECMEGERNCKPSTVPART